ncbi:hypothetical protein GCM10010916_49270 [Paenibacillus abyssi]|uniref:Uncharacterized protein n=1 Tax=Paenibacillus abyssi TaxID=1340531 RepID=A0A917G7W1_9BACL|nr:hypothetical protein GCM10010916_49270 [Paenibacillus abyssi]
MPLIELPPRADQGNTRHNNAPASSLLPDLQSVILDKVKADLHPAMNGCANRFNEGGTASKSFSSLEARRIFCVFYNDKEDG